MDNELDFRVGDVVCDYWYGTGKVQDIDYSKFIYVLFDNGILCVYNSRGRMSSSLHPHRSLYHGTWEQVFGNLPNLKPKRKVKRWVNLYTNGEWELYDSKEKARDFLGINPSKPVAVAVEIEVDE